MSASTVYGLRPPERTVELKTGNLSREDIIKSTYEAWLSVTEGMRWRTETRDEVYSIACSIIRPFRKRLSGALTESDLKPIENDARTWASVGLYLTALLNETDLDRLSLGLLELDLEGLGYRLSEGKTVIINDGIRCHEACHNAQGGLMINLKWVPSRLRAISNVGADADNGTFLNFGGISYFGERARGGLWINAGKVTGMGQEAEGGIFITRDIGDFSFPEDYQKRTGVWAFGRLKLKADAKLSGLVDEIEAAGRDKYVNKVRRLAREIDAHVKKNYKPRSFP